MAEGESKANPAGLALGLLGFLAIITLGWFMFGGWRNADLSGYFLAPPSAPQVIVPGDGTAIIQGSTTTAPTHQDQKTAPRL